MRRIVAYAAMTSRERNTADEYSKAPGLELLFASE
jgi:hypothetical protein